MSEVPYLLHIYYKSMGHDAGPMKFSHISVDQPELDTLSQRTKHCMEKSGDKRFDDMMNHLARKRKNLIDLTHKYIMTSSHQL